MKRGCAHASAWSPSDGCPYRGVDHGARSSSRRSRAWCSPAGTSSSRTCTRARCTTRCCRRTSSSRFDPARAPSSPGPRCSPSTTSQNLDRQERRPREELPRARSRSSRRTSRPSRSAHNLDRLVVVNLASTERFLEVQPVHKSLKAFEAGARRERPGHHAGHAVLLRRQQAPYPVLQLHAEPHERPCAAEQAEEMGNPYAGMDGKTGQTLLKTALAPMFRARRLSSRAGTRPTCSATATAWCSKPRVEQDQGAEQGGRARLHRRLPRGKPPGSHPLLQAARRRERGLGQHRHRRALPACRCRSR